MAPANTNEIRALTEDEIARLENALGQPIERSYLSRWVSQAIQAFLLLMTVPPPRERRDDLKAMAEQGRKWIETVEQSRSARLLPPLVDVEHLMSWPGRSVTSPISGAATRPGCRAGSSSNHCRLGSISRPFDWNCQAGQSPPQHTKPRSA